jgi:predicted metal-binding membrane protein
MYDPPMGSTRSVACIAHRGTVFDGRGGLQGVAKMPVVALAASALAWAALLLAATVGGSGLFASSMSVGTSAGSASVFLAAWEVMVIAMMLPSSIDFFSSLHALTHGAERQALRRTGAYVGYGLAWAWLGCVAALLGETLYRVGLVGSWLEANANLLAGGVLILAGAYQFTGFKRRCLHPSTLRVRHRGGARDAFVLGLNSGLMCVGCCWALMALMVVLGGGSLVAMLGLTAVMFAERALGWDDRFVQGVGFACVVLGALVVSSPHAVPALAANAQQWIGMQSLGMHMQWPMHGMIWCHG